MTRGRALKDGVIYQEEQKADCDYGTHINTNITTEPQTAFSMEIKQVLIVCLISF